SRPLASAGPVGVQPARPVHVTWACGRTADRGATSRRACRSRRVRGVRGGRAVGRTPPRHHLTRLALRMERLLLISLGGAIGTALRYLTSVLAARWFGTDFPYGTLIVNLAGAFIIGVVQQIGTQTALIPDNTRLFVTPGMMGGLTTYSAFTVEDVHLMELAAWLHARSHV